MLRGLGGNDRLDGKGGDDVLHGGDGNDALTGGPGKDTVSAVQATTRTPGPSTAEPVVNEWRKPTSPLSIDFLTNDS